MTDRELMQQALEALERCVATCFDQRAHEQVMSKPEHFVNQNITALRERLAQPEFIKHEEGGDGWSDWVCPDPDDYLIKCCDCGLVHEAQFRVVKYAPAPSEECEIVNDPNLQAVFRMRRSQRWTPDDTAHRSGGLPMAQPEQEPVAWMDEFGNVFSLGAQRGPKHLNEPMKPLYTAPQRREWVGLTDEEIEQACVPLGAAMLSFTEVARAIEAKLKEKNA